MILFVIFVVMLGGLLFLHHHKLAVVAAGFVAMMATSASLYGWSELGHHFGEPHVRNLLINLGFLIPGFSIVAAAFERCGIAEKIRDWTNGNPSKTLWTVFVLSTFLDNIAAAMIGGILVMGGARPSFRMLVGIIAASNLGGAGSPIGDTTTVMMYVSTHPVVPTWQLFVGFIGAVPAMFCVNWWVAGHPVSEGTETGSIDEPTQMDLAVEGAGDDPAALAESEKLHGRIVVRWLWLLLGIPGLVIGNVVADQPALGLWSGILLGCLVGWKRPSVEEVLKTVPNALFLVLLVAAAEMLPLKILQGWVEGVNKDGVAVLMGLLSPWFDNIPLTALCLRMDGFFWGLLAYTVGFGGSAMWFGSSAGVALGLIHKRIYDTRQWWGWSGPFVAMTLSYFVGVVCIVFFKWLVL